MMTTRDPDILLIDSNIKLRDELALRLRSSGFIISIAKGGFHAIKEIEENKVKVIVISNHMSDMSIEEMVTIIRSMEYRSNTPIILYSPPIDEDLEINSLLKILKIEHLQLSREYPKLLNKIKLYV